MKLISIELNNFQSHVNTVINFGKLTVFTGATNSGKSAIMRALDCLFKNPSGMEKYRRRSSNGKQKPRCEIKAVLEDDKKKRFTISRIWSDTENSVTINDIVYNTINRAFPEDWIHKLGISPTIIGSDSVDVSCYKQGDPPFLIKSPGPDAGKLLGIISGVQIIDQIIVKINQEYKSLQQSSKTAKAEVETLEQKCLNLENCMIKKEVIDQAQESLTQTMKMSAQLNALRDLMKCFSDIKRLEDLKEHLDVNSLISDKYKIDEKMGKLEYELQALQLTRQLQECNDQINSLGEQKEENQEIINESERTLQDLVKDRCPLCKRKGKIS